MTDVISLIVAMEILAAPLWACTVAVRGPGRGGRLLRALAPVVLVLGVLVVMAAAQGGSFPLGVVWTQAVAAAFVLFLFGLAGAIDRAAGPRTGQAVAALVGWLIIGAIFVGAAAAETLEGDVRTWTYAAIVEANPLVVAEQQLGFNWFHAPGEVTYALSPVADNYALGSVPLWRPAVTYAAAGVVLALAGRGREPSDSAEKPAP